MREAPSDLPVFAEADRKADPQDILVELTLDGYRVVGQLHRAGAARRLVDILNAADSPSVVIQDGELHPLSSRGEQARSFEVIHVQRNAIQFAVPRADPTPRPNLLDLITKVPVPVTIVLPSFQITGNIHLAPDVDPALASFLASNRFVPITDAAIVSVQDRGCAWQEPIIVVNLGRALGYALRRSGRA